MTYQTLNLPLEPLCVILKYQFQNHTDGTLTSNKANGFCFFLTFHPNCCKFGERVRNSVKTVDCFMTTTNACIQHYTTTVISNHLCYLVNVYGSVMSVILTVFCVFDLAHHLFLSNGHILWTGHL